MFFSTKLENPNISFSGLKILIKMSLSNKSILDAYSPGMISLNGSSDCWYLSHYPQFF